MTKPDIAAIRARAAAATPGPWRWYLGSLMNETDSSGQGFPLDIYPDSEDVVSARDHSGDEVSLRVADADAAFIAAARTDIPALCDRIDELEAALARAERVARAARSYFAARRECVSTFLVEDWRRFKDADDALRAALDAAGETP